VTLSSLHCVAVLEQLAKFSASCGTRVAAAKRLGISKSALTKWFDKKVLTSRSLQKLAVFDGDLNLAQAARRALAASGTPVPLFDFPRVASQLLCAVSATGMLFETLHGNASVEELEFATAYDFVSGLADLHYYESLAELALEGFPKLPRNPLQFGTSDYERALFPDKEQPIGTTVPKTIDLNTIDWEKINEPRKRRSEAARSIMDGARHGPAHKLFQRILDETCSLWKDRDPETPMLSDQECLKIAGLAAVDAYKTESGLIEAAKTIINAVDSERSLEKSPIYAIANKMFEMRYPMRQQTIGRVGGLREALTENKEVVSKMDGLCGFVYDALYSGKGVTFFHPGSSAATVNKHGAVFEYKKTGQIVRGGAGKKRLAPKKAIHRGGRATPVPPRLRKK
jgi:hypothetical protein